MPTRRWLTTLMAGAMLVTFAPVVTASAAEPTADPTSETTSDSSDTTVTDVNQMLDLTFPTDRSATFSDTYTACRSGCARTHQATDIIGAKMMPLYAVVEGTVCRIDDGEEDSYGRHITICGDDGIRYRYLHLNNDNPGTDDGQAGLEDVFAPGIRRGVRVARGQHIAYMGDSGNAEESVAHLHFDIFVPGFVNPWGEERINPYPSLMAALDRGDVADGTAVYTEETARVAGPDRIATAIELSRAAFESADDVILAPSTTPAEAIVAGPLADAMGGPVLTTPPDALDERVLAEIARLGASRVTVVGNLSGLDALGPVVRIAGDDQFETAALVAERVWELTGASGDAFVGGLVGDEPKTGGPQLVARTRDGDEVALDGAAVDVAFSVSLEGVDPRDVRRVDFWVDDPERDGEPVNRERRYPYDLKVSGHDVLDPAFLDEGGHTVTARIRYDDRRPEVVTATFDVGAAGTARRAVVALGEHEDPARAWPDSLMASYYGSARDLPVLLVGQGRLPEVTEAVLDGVAEVTVIGGPAAVDEATFETIAELVGNADRLFGASRYSTATAVTNDLLERRLVHLDRVWAATGGNWPDAATSGPVVARRGDALVLVDGSGAGADVEATDWLGQRREAISSGTAIGGPAAVADDALTTLGRTIT